MKIKTVFIQSSKLNAAIAAFGPGTTEIGISFCCANVTSSEPGSFMQGVPASETRATFKPCSSLFMKNFFYFFHCSYYLLLVLY